MKREIKTVSYQDTKPFILDIHYAKRMPSISFAYGLFIDGRLEGICTYGSPASPWLCKGICGDRYRKEVLELNRLVLKNNRKNDASYLISNSLKMLPRPKILVSYADTAFGHSGAVYKASNWLFTGTTKPRTDMSAGDGKHSRHHKGDKTNRVNRSAKHRFVNFIGTKKEKKIYLNALNYPVMDYTKGETKC